MNEFKPEEYLETKGYNDLWFCNRFYELLEAEYKSDCSVDDDGNITYSEHALDQTLIDTRKLAAENGR